MINAETQAFPSPTVLNPDGTVNEIGSDGITKLEYFAAHAPEIPEWFKPELRPEPIKPAYFSNAFGKTSSYPHSDFYRANWDEENEVWICKEEEIPEKMKTDLEALSQKWNNYISDHEKWEMEYRLARIYQWRWKYANLMLSVILDQEQDEVFEKIRTLLKTNINDLDLSVRAFNCLRANDIETLGGIASIDKKKLKNFRNIGAKSIIEVEECLASNGLKFGMNLEKYKL